MLARIIYSRITELWIYKLNELDSVCYIVHATHIFCKLKGTSFRLEGLLIDKKLCLNQSIVYKR